MNARIIDENVEGAELCLGVGDHRSDLGRLHHIGAIVESLDAELFFDFGPLRLDRRRIAHAIDDDIGAFLGQRAGDGEPDAAGRAGDEGVALRKRHQRLLIGRAGESGVILRRNKEGEAETP